MDTIEEGLHEEWHLPERSEQSREVESLELDRLVGVGEEIDVEGEVA